MTKQGEQKLTHEQFVLAAIVNLREGKHRGIHTVWTGFNGAFREYFPDADPVAATQALNDDGKIVMRRAKGGAVIYLPGEAPRIIDNALGKILGDKK